mgnify:CR=1 FL=1
MYHSILVPIDTSHIERVAAMLALAKKLCASDGSIVCLNVLHEIPPLVVSHLPTGFHAGLMADARETIEKEVSAANVDARVEIQTGHAAETTLAYADQIGADLIIIGSHKPGLEDYFLGSTASRVVRHAKSSVLVQR